MKMQTALGSASSDLSVSRSAAFHDNAVVFSGDPILRTFLHRLLPGWLRRPVGRWISDQQTRRSPDRLYLQRELLPAVGARQGRVLFIGVRRYTAAYPKLLARHGAECWTVDIDPTVARWGAKARHTVADAQVLDRHFAPGFFDSVVLSGVFGYGVDTEVQQNAVLTAVGAVLKHDGMLVLGWNTDKIPDPIHCTELRRFSPTCLAGRCSRVEFDGSTHVFDFFRNAQRPAAAS